MIPLEFRTKESAPKREPRGAQGAQDSAPFGYWIAIASTRKLPAAPPAPMHWKPMPFAAVAGATISERGSYAAHCTVARGLNARSSTAPVEYVGSTVQLLPADITDAGSAGSSAIGVTAVEVPSAVARRTWNST